jgi:hypothetical protein
MRPRVELEIFAAPHEKAQQCGLEICVAPEVRTCAKSGSETREKRVKVRTVQNLGLRTFCSCRQRTKLGLLCCVGSGDFTVCQASFAYSLCSLVFSSQEQFVCLFV